MQVYLNDFISIEYNESLSLIKYAWNEETTEMNEEDYRACIFVLVSQLESYRPKHLLANMFKRQLNISIELQVWVAYELLGKLKNLGIQKYAMVETENLILHLSFEQALDEDSIKGYQHRYFSDEKKAIEWLTN